MLGTLEGDTDGPHIRCAINVPVMFVSFVPNLARSVIRRYTTSHRCLHVEEQKTEICADDDGHSGHLSKHPMNFSVSPPGTVSVGPERWKELTMVIWLATLTYYRGNVHKINTRMV
jgi:hypothetical protein